VVFLILGRVLSKLRSPSVNPSRERKRGRGRWQKIVPWRAVGAQALFRPQDHARCARWGLRRDVFNLGPFLSKLRSPSANLSQQRV
jgi:hypothetical protein